FVAGPIKSRAVPAGDVRVNAEAAGACAGVILLADVGEINIAKLVLMIEGDQQASVAHRNIARHVEPLFGYRARVLRDPSPVCQRTPQPLRRCAGIALCPICRMFAADSSME